LHSNPDKLRRNAQYFRCFRWFYVVFPQSIPPFYVFSALCIFPGLGLATVIGCITGLGIFPYQVARVNDSFSFLCFSVPALFTV
jgi:hypothetical protein